MSDAAALRRLAEAATPGIWRQFTYTDHDGPPSCDDIGVQAVNFQAHAFEVLCTMDWSAHPSDFTREQATANAAYIAAANPAAVLALLDEVERLRTEVARLQPKPQTMGYGSISHCGCWSRGTYGGEHYEFKCDTHKQEKP